MEFKRGNIHYINNGSVGLKTRPGLIVSTDMLNEHSPVVKVVYLTSQEKYEAPYHVHIGTDRDSIALCEGIYTINKDRVGDFYKTCTDEEMYDIDTGLMYSLDLGEPDDVASDRYDLIEHERDFYKNLYEDLLDRVVGK